MVTSLLIGTIGKTGLHFTFYESNYSVYFKSQKKKKVDIILEL